MSNKHPPMSRFSFSVNHQWWFCDYYLLCYFPNIVCIQPSATCCSTLLNIFFCRFNLSVRKEQFTTKHSIRSIKHWNCVLCSATFDFCPQIKLTRAFMNVIQAVLQVQSLCWMLKERSRSLMIHLCRNKQEKSHVCEIVCLHEHLSRTRCGKHSAFFKTTYFPFVCEWAGSFDRIFDDGNLREIKIVASVEVQSHEMFGDGWVIGAEVILKVWRT